MILNQSHTAAPRTRRLSPHTRVHPQRQKSPPTPSAVTSQDVVGLQMRRRALVLVRLEEPVLAASVAAHRGLAGGAPTGKRPRRRHRAPRRKGLLVHRLARACRERIFVRICCVCDAASKQPACVGWVRGRAPQAWERGGWAAMVVSIMETAVCVLTPSLYVMASLSMCRVCTLAEVWYSFSTGVHIRSWRWWARPSRGWRRRRGSGRARAGRGRGRAPRTARPGRRRPWC